jgi:hypothetical protein
MRLRIGPALDPIRALGWLFRAERSKRRTGPTAVVAVFRAAGMRAPSRSPSERARLRSLIRRLDHYFPAGPNCYRRALVEIAMDAGAAREPLHLGLNLSPRAGGHAWLSSDAADGAAYEVELRM